MTGTAGYDSYIICATPRSGSTLLCDMLEATGVAGKPDSFFMADPDPHWQQVWGLPQPDAPDDAAYARAFIAAARRAGRDATGLFGMRLMQRDLDRFLGLVQLASPAQTNTRDRLTHCLGRCLFVHLTREDKLAQAVSLVIAQQTGLWHITASGAERERLASPAPPRYDHSRIAHALSDLTRQDRLWADWFNETGIRPVNLSYTALSADPGAEVARLCRSLGVQPPDLRTLRPDVGKLANALNVEWISRFSQGGTLMQE
ncbi:Stf0 family sulfotransferase [Lacimonas salitolerans]|uniref:Stf0 family sulfotransferase n=1 Tax=Lacimonas salitolerans TaxID=1323750 RepID=A0ABW4EB09_9RHOB